MTIKLEVQIPFTKNVKHVPGAIGQHIEVRSLLQPQEELSSSHVFCPYFDCLLPVILYPVHDKDKVKCASSTRKSIV